ncbi:DUF1028 domain-containing protein [Haloactinomyces albus]|uniref:Ntn-hydrolase superfamily protein n=1 Tax=Haloactinomyces albus TaxID=1352928 RepID=A0AAE4CN69_9ACTN|nr:DUF1028 domain-containing protein [Haloactinomyces albus]MDR7303594.1 putative Ntn-hydrolase superfamily protein [Haloactinomyces albus]
MTFSITARCRRTGALGVAISSSSPAVASRCAYVSPTVGAVCSQNVTDPRLGPRLLGLLELGVSAQQAVDQVTRSETDIAYRQLAAVGASGIPAVYSGDHALGTFGSATGNDSVAAGNMLTSTKVLDSMVEDFETDEHPTMARRLLAALSAGLAAGGEEGPVHSAGLLVAHTAPWPVVDLRIDWTEGDPITELERLLDVWEPQQDDYVQRGLHPSAAPGYGVPGDL